jgi:hypothetical protein
MRQESVIRAVNLNGFELRRRRGNRAASCRAGRAVNALVPSSSPGGVVSNGRAEAAQSQEGHIWRIETMTSQLASWTGIKSCNPKG